jgi:hypothetical protein
VDKAKIRRQSGEEMDPVLALANRALAEGDVLEALKRVALREDAPALALRGVALARLGDLARARELLRAAARSFGVGDALGRARCLLADAEIALYRRELAGVEATLESLSEILAAHGDQANAVHARCLLARSLLLRGRMEEAKEALARLPVARVPALLEAEVALARAELALRTLDARGARVALARAEESAKRARIPALSREVASAVAMLDAPCARSTQRGEERLLRPAQLEALLRKRRTLFVDALHQVVRRANVDVNLARRPVLFALLRALTLAWPNASPRGALIQSAFAVIRPNESHRARLRVELGRLRRALTGLAGIRATPDGFRLEPVLALVDDVVLLTHPFDDEHSTLLALLADGEAWSSSALGVALGASQRSVQRALLSLAAAGKVRSTGRARAKRWLRVHNHQFATALLLPSALSIA